jgi:hypothetical protein
LLLNLLTQPLIFLSYKKMIKHNNLRAKEIYLLKNGHQLCIVTKDESIMIINILDIISSSKEKNNILFNTFESKFIINLSNSSYNLELLYNCILSCRPVKTTSCINKYSRSDNISLSKFYNIKRNYMTVILDDQLLFNRNIKNIRSIEDLTYLRRKGVPLYFKISAKNKILFVRKTKNPIEYKSIMMTDYLNNKYKNKEKQSDEGVSSNTMKRLNNEKKNKITVDYGSSSLKEIKRKHKIELFTNEGRFLKKTNGIGFLKYSTLIETGNLTRDILFCKGGGRQLIARKTLQDLL